MQIARAVARPQGRQRGADRAHGLRAACRRSRARHASSSSASKVPGGGPPELTTSRSRPPRPSTAAAHRRGRALGRREVGRDREAAERRGPLVERRAEGRAATRHARPRPPATSRSPPPRPRLPPPTSARAPSRPRFTGAARRWSWPAPARRISHSARWSSSDRWRMAAGGSNSRARWRARTAAPSWVSASIFTRRSPGAGRRSSRPRSSSRSTMPVTFELSQASTRARSPIGRGSSGSRTLRVIACMGVRSSSASVAVRCGRSDVQRPKSRRHASWALLGAATPRSPAVLTSTS